MPAGKPIQINICFGAFRRFEDYGSGKIRVFAGYRPIKQPNDYFRSASRQLHQAAKIDQGNVPDVTGRDFGGLWSQRHRLLPFRYYCRTCDIVIGIQKAKTNSRSLRQPRTQRNTRPSPLVEP
jgi:hypothetical protein